MMNRMSLITVRSDVLGYIFSHTDPCTLTVAELIFALQLPRSSLYRAFTAFGGVNEYLISLRLESSKRLLSAGMTCGMVSRSCGFKSLPRLQ